MSRKKLLTISGLVLLLLILAISPAGARQDVIYAEAIEVFCTYEVGKAWVEGDMYYERGSRETGFKIPLTEGDPFPYGTYEVKVNLDLNLALGKGSAYGKAVFKPPGVPGLFTGSWSGMLYEKMPAVWWSIDIKGRSVGQKGLEGWRVRSKSYSIDPSPYAGMCDGADPFGVSKLHIWYYPPD